MPCVGLRAALGWYTREGFDMARSKKRDSGGGLIVTLFIVVVLLYAGQSFQLGDVVPLLLVVAALVAVVWLVRRLAGPRTATAKELTRRFEAVREMSGAQFEVFTADLFRAMGHPATVLGGSGDQGVDLVVVYEGQRTAVQCKNYKKVVGNKPVQEIYAGARHHGCALAWVVAPSGYTKGAFELARSVGVALFDGDSVRQWIKQVDKVERERERAIETRTSA